MSNKIFVILIGIGVIFVAIMTIFPVTNFRKYYDRIFVTELTSIPMPTSTGAPSPVPTLGNTASCYNFTLTDTDTGKKVFETVSKNLLKGFDKKILYAINKQGIDGANLYSYNPESKETKVIYTYPRSEQARMLSEIYNIYPSGDKIFFGVGGYFAPGAFYRLDNLDGAEPVKISDISNPRVVKINDSDYLWGGNGDGCGGMGTYSKFNAEAGTVSEPFLELGMGCVAGDDIVYQAKDVWYISNHTEKKTEPALRPFGHVHTNLVSVVPFEPFTRTTLLDESKMPENITGIAYLGNRFILSGEKPIPLSEDGIYSSKKTIYTYSPVDNNINEVTSFETGECTMQTNSSKPDLVCYSCYGSENASEIIVDLKNSTNSKKVLKNEESACADFEQFNPFTSDPDVTVNDKTEELELPPNLKLSCDS